MTSVFQDAHNEGMINQNTPGIVPEDRLTAYDYMRRPLRELIPHPDFDPVRAVQLKAALNEATNLIQSAIRQGKLEA